MAVIRPFRALRPIREKAKEVSSPPYDVVTVEEAKELVKGDPESFLHVIRSEIDLPPETDPYDTIVYKKARENFNRLIESGVMIEEQKPILYIYRLKTGEHTQTGVVCCGSVDEYDSDIIKKHEHTRKEKEDDRLRHMLALSAHAGPVLMTCRKVDIINKIVSQETEKEPLYDFISDDRIGHTIWQVWEPAPLIEAFKNVKNLYIADGHHRAAGASRVRQYIREKIGNIKGDEEFNFFLMVVFPEEELRILPYNRYVSDLGSFDKKGFMNEIKKRFRVVENDKKEPTRKGYFCMFLCGKWYELYPNEKERKNSDPVSALDLSVFQKTLLEPVLGIMDQKKDKRIDFVGGEKGVQKLEKKVEKEGGVAFTFYPVSIQELMAVSDAGMVMPPKSTWFHPKLRSGLLVHRFEDFNLWF